MTSMQMVNVAGSVPVTQPRAAFDLPDAPLTMPEQDLRPSATMAGNVLGWLGQRLRGVRITSTHGAAR